MCICSLEKILIRRGWCPPRAMIFVMEVTEIVNLNKVHETQWCCVRVQHHSDLAHPSLYLHLWRGHMSQTWVALQSHAPGRNARSWDQPCRTGATAFGWVWAHSLTPLQSPIPGLTFQYPLTLPWIFSSPLCCEIYAKFLCQNSNLVYIPYDTIRMKQK